MHFSVFSRNPPKTPIFDPPGKWPFSRKTPKMPKLRGCEIPLGGGTNMWSNPPNYLLFRYPPWPPKWGFLDPPPGGWFWGGTANSNFAHVRNVCFLYTPENTYLTHPETGDFGCPEIGYFGDVRIDPIGNGIHVGDLMCSMEPPGRRRNFDQSYGWGVGEIPE